MTPLISGIIFFASESSLTINSGFNLRSFFCPANTFESLLLEQYVHSKGHPLIGNILYSMERNPDLMIGALSFRREAISFSKKKGLSKSIRGKGILFKS